MLYKIYLLGRYLYEERVFHNGKPEDVLKVIQKFMKMHGLNIQIR